jgi:hypothetical protein
MIGEKKAPTEPRATVTPSSAERPMPNLARIGTVAFCFLPQHAPVHRAQSSQLSSDLPRRPALRPPAPKQDSVVFVAVLCVFVPIHARHAHEKRPISLPHNPLGPNFYRWRIFPHSRRTNRPRVLHHPSPQTSSDGRSADPAARAHHSLHLPHCTRPRGPRPSLPILRALARL